MRRNRFRGCLRSIGDREPLRARCLTLLPNSYQQVECDASGFTEGVDADSRPFRISNLKMVDPRLDSWNQVVSWLKLVDALSSSQVASTTNYS